MNRRAERLLINFYWVLSFVLMFVGLYFYLWSGRGIWLVGGGLVMFLYLLFTDKYTVRDLMARDALDASVRDLETVIQEIEREDNHAND